MNDKARVEWFKRHHGLKEAGWAAHFAVEYTADRRAEILAGLRDGTIALHPVGAFTVEEMRRRWIDALEELELLEDHEPDAGAIDSAAQAIARARSSS